MCIRQLGSPTRSHWLACGVGLLRASRFSPSCAHPKKTRLALPRFPRCGILHLDIDSLAAQTARFVMRQFECRAVTGTTSGRTTAVLHRSLRKARDSRTRSGLTGAWVWGSRVLFCQQPVLTFSTGRTVTTPLALALCGTSPIE
jgi:hypothetical protein